MVSVAICPVFKGDDEYAEDTGVFELFGDSERERIDSISSSRARELSLCGLISLKYLTDRSGVDCNLNIERGDNGKPYFKTSGYFFNISHSFEISVAVFSDDRVGIDIERMVSRPSLSKVAKRFFSESEYSRYIESRESIESFYRIWTAKEAAVKYRGASLATSLSEDGMFDTEVFFKTVFFEYSGDRYMMTVCLPLGDDVEILSVNEDIRIEF